MTEQKNKKSRSNKKQPMIYGFHAIASLLRMKPDCVAWIGVQSGRDDERAEELKQLAAQQSVTVQAVSKKQCDEWAEGNHQGFVAACHHLPHYTQADLLLLLQQINDPLIVILDGVQDPHNLGAIMRTSDAMGATAIVIPKDKSVGMTATVQKVACGAAMTVPLVTVTNLSRCMQQLQQQGLWLVGLDAEADNRIADIDLKGPVGVVMGNEGKGMRRVTRERCDFLAHIPMQGTVSSMNVSVATGMVLYEVTSQRLN